MWLGAVSGTKNSCGVIENSHNNFAIIFHQIRFLVEHLNYCTQNCCLRIIIKPLCIAPVFPSWFFPGTIVQKKVVLNFCVSARISQFPVFYFPQYFYGENCSRYLFVVRMCKQIVKLN